MKEYPLIKYVIIFIAGILSAKYLQFSFYTSFVFILSLVSISIILFLVKQKKYIYIFNLVTFFVIGNLYLSFNNQTETEYPFEKTKISKTVLFGDVTDIQLIHSDELKITVKSDSLIVLDSTHLITNYFQCNISFASKARTNQLYNQ